jgi:hypothetical protein
MSAVSIEKVALGILADAVDRTVGTGFVHAAITRAASTLESSDVSQADRAFRMLNPRECKKVRDTAIENAELYRDFGDYSDPTDELSPDPRLKDIRAKSSKLGSG